ncbi:unnamed protein product [Lampetra planeri]
MQHFAVMADAPLASDTGLQDAHARLAELLLAAAAVLADICVPASGKTAAGVVEEATVEDSRQRALRAKSLEVAAVFGGPPPIGGKDGRHVAGHLRAAQPTSSARAGALHFAPDNRADILHNSSGARENLSDVDDDRVLQQRLPALSAFKADGGDWGAFQRRFLAHQEMSGWSDTTALRALPAMLDDDALAAFTSAARSSRSTLQAALHLMAKVFGPPSTCRHQFYDRRKVAGETTLAYRTALLALADAAFPRMDKEGKDAMVTEQLLVLAHELGVPINVADEMEICSLAIATSIHAYEVLKRKPGVVCKWPGNAALAATIAEPQPAAVQERGFAASCPGEWRTGGRSPTRSPRKLEQPKPTTSVVCYNCGLRGHVAAGCRAPRPRAAGPRRDDDQGHKSSQQNPASRGTSHVRSTNTAHSGRRFAGTVLAHAAPLPVEERLVAQADFTVESHPQSDEGTEWLDSLCAGSANLSGVQLGALRGLLIEFADVFSKHKYDIGCTDLLRHPIATGDAAPIRQNPFRLSPAEKEHPSGQLSRWLEVLQDYQFTTIYRKGLRHSNADALSRLPPCTDCTCLLGSARCKPPVAGTPGVALAATDTPGEDAPTGRDSLLSLPLIEWGRLQMSDSSLLTLRRKVGAPEQGEARVGSWVCRQGLLMRWDNMSRRHVLVVPVAMRGASGLTAADRREPEPRGTHESSMPGRCLPEPPAPPDVQPRLVPYDGPARRTRARSQQFS